MGIDARIFIAGAPDLSEEFKAEIGLLLSPYAKEEQRIFVGLYEGWTALEGYERYFGGGYSRGNWPRIRKAILRTIEEYPGLTVRYGGDNSDPEWLCEVTPEMLAKIDEDWRSLHDDPHLKADGDCACCCDLCSDNGFCSCSECDCQKSVGT